MSSNTDNTEATNGIITLQIIQEKRESRSNYENFYFSKRFLIVILIFIGRVVLMNMRLNLSMAIIEMTTSSKNASNVNGSASFNGAEFVWSSKQKGLLLGAIYYGYVLGPILGYLASKFGGVTMFGFGIAGNALITLLSPTLARLDFNLFVASRIISGVLQVISMVSVAEIWSRWSPPNERSKLSCFSFTGHYCGSMISFPLTGIIGESYGWPVIFYATGAIPILWSIIWFLLVSNDPTDDKFITKREKLYLQEQINSQRNEKITFSLKSIFTSMPVWAIFITKFTIGFGQTIIVLTLPQYIKDVGDMDIKDIGYLSAIPQLSTIFIHPLASCLADYLRNSKIMNPTQVHKLYICSACFLGAVLCYITGSSTFVVAIICLSLQRLLFSYSEVVFQVIDLDMAPQHASVLNGISGLFYTVSAIASSIFVGHVVTSHSVSEWNACYNTFGVFYIFGGVFFLIFGSGELQPWATILEQEKLGKSDIIIGYNNKMDGVKDKLTTNIDKMSRVNSVFSVK